MHPRQALDALTQSLKTGVSHQISTQLMPEVRAILAYIQKNTPKIHDKPLLFYFEFHGSLCLWLVENFKIFSDGPKIIEKFKEGYGKSWQFHLNLCLKDLAYSALYSTGHSLYLKDFGCPRPQRALIEGYPEPSLN